MGDVFDAMNRSNKEREENKKQQQAPKPAEQSSSADAQDDAPPKQEGAGGLPIDDVNAQPLGKETQEVGSTNLSAPAFRERQDSVVADASDKAGAAKGKQAAESKAKPATRGATAVSDAFERSDPSRVRSDDANDNTISAPVKAPPSDDSADDSADQAAAASGAPSDIAKLNGYALQVVVHHDRGSVVTEQYRAIRTQILARSRTRRLQTHVITSSTPEEGKSVTVLNLGVAFSELRNQRTLLIEGDLRRPAFEKLFDRKCDNGLMQLLRGDVDDYEQILHPTVYDNLQFIPSGGRDPNHSTELLSSPRMVQLLDRLKDRYDHIFFDSPPVVTVTDSCILGQMADGVMMVVRLNKTPSDVVDRAKRLLRASSCEISGVILTHMKHQMPRYLYRYDRYGANYR